MPYNPQFASAVTRQRGQAALIAVLMVFGVATATLVYTLATPANRTIENDKKIYAAMAQARDALIGYAASQATQPGVLPCPDNDNDGSADSPCGVLGATDVGRLPWKTLGLPDLRDGTGECLWYAVSGNFKNSGASGPASLNSDSPGTLSIVDSNGTTVYGGTNKVVAIVFAPGLALSGQDRTATPGPSTVCGGNNTPSNYLDSLTVGATTYNNATGSGADTFIMSSPSGTSSTSDRINDRSLAITSDALFAVVNVRVAKEAISALEAYHNVAGVGYYPFANAYGSASPYYCNSGLNRGRFPVTTTGVGSCGQAPWPASTDTFRTWFLQNNWTTVTHYSISKACGQFAFSGLPYSLVPGLAGIIQGLCTTTGSLSGLIGEISPLPGVGALSATEIADLLGVDEPLTVSSVSNNVRTLVIVSGRALGQTHPCTNATNCMEDAANRNGETGDPNGATVYVKPSTFPTSNDRMAFKCADNFPCSSVLP